MGKAPQVPVLSRRRRHRLTPGCSLPAPVVILACILVACSPAGQTRGLAGSGPADNPHTPALRPVAVNPRPILPVQVRSADGRNVEVSRVDRIVPLAGNLSEMVFSLGLGPRVVGRDISTTFREASDLPLVTRAHDVSAEALLSLKPSLVLAQTDTGPPEALDQVRRSGVPVVVVDKPSSLKDIGDRARLIARAVGLPGLGETLAERIRFDIEEVRRAVPRDDRPPRVAFLYMRGQAGVYLIGGTGAGSDSMIQAAGGRDAGTAMGLTRPFTPITSEALVKARPDAILMTTTGLESVGGVDGLLRIPGIAETPAGLSRRIITLEDGLLFSFGARTPVALAALIRKLYSPKTEIALTAPVQRGSKRVAP